METLNVPGPLRLKLGDSAAEGLVQMFAQSDHLAAERFDLRVLETKLEVRSELERGLASIRVEIERTRADVIKWNLVFWIGQFAAMIAVLSVMLGRH